MQAELRRDDASLMLKDVVIIGRNTKLALELLSTIHIKFSTFGFDLHENVAEVADALKRLESLDN